MSPLDAIGRPWRWGASGPEAYDCFGLVLAFVPEIPDSLRDPARHGATIAQAMAAGRSHEGWERLSGPDSAQDGDVALFGPTAAPRHTGLLWRLPEGLRCIHALRGVGVVCEPLGDMARRGLGLEGVYRWRP